MKLVWWMLAGSVLSSFAITVLLGDESLEVWLGMLGPLGAAAASWIAVERQHSKGPEGVTAVLIRAFAAKMIFFAAYVTAILGVFGGASVRSTPFVISFISYFLALHATEAFGLYRLQVAVASPGTFRT